MASSSTHSKRLTNPFSLATFLVIVSCCTHFTLAARELSTADDDKAMRERYEKWMAEHGRTYKDSAEKARRFEVFKSNAHFIDSYNAAAGPGGKSRARLTTNKFADLTEAELSNNRHRTGPPSAVGTGFMYGNMGLSDVPASIDWREKGAVTPVRNQDQFSRCDCCWAFSAVAAVEGIHQIRTNNLVSLSAQELVDCSTGANNHGCNLGDADEAFRHILHSGGITTDDAYGYESKQSTCRSSGKQVAATISGFQHVPPRNETALMLAVAHQPVSVALDGKNMAMFHYSTGVYGAGAESCTTDLNHAMTIVGYGTDEYGTKYWLLKNSWGSDWGEHGYVKIKRDVTSSTGLCGLAMQAVYPTA